MTEKITTNQENRLTDLFREGLRMLSFTKDEAQEIISNGGTLQVELTPILKKLAIADKRFGPAIREFDITVPTDYKHDSQIDTFAKKTKKLKTTYYYNDELTSENFAKVTNKLIPGKTYKVKIFPILSRVASEDCLAFLRKQNALFTGGQGLTLVQDLKADEFPIGKSTISFDEKDALWEDADGDHRVPFVGRVSVGDWRFGLGYFEYDWDSGFCLFCLCDCEEVL